MITQNLGYPRIGSQRELKKATESFWAKKITEQELLIQASYVKRKNWQVQKEQGIDIIPSNDFSLYDHVLDMSLIVGAVPNRFQDIANDKSVSEIELMFAMARGYQKDNLNIKAMEMTKWFDTNYHYIVPEFYKNQKFELNSNKIFAEFNEAKELGFITKPVIIGPISYLLLGKEKENNFHRIDLISNLLPVYFEIFTELETLGVDWIQIDEPFLSLELTKQEQKIFAETYHQIRDKFPKLKIVLASYFDCTGDNLDLAINLPIDTLHVDLVRCVNQLDDILKTNFVNKKTNLSLGIIDGRNVWKNNYQDSINTINKAVKTIGLDRVWISPSCSLLHSPCDLDLETNEKNLKPEIKQWLSFAKQKLNEVSFLKKILLDNSNYLLNIELENNNRANANRKFSNLIHNPLVKQRVSSIKPRDYERKNDFPTRKILQKEILNLPLYPTTTIGSFPQTPEVRSWRAKHNEGLLSQQQYDDLISIEIEKAIKWQEEIGIDVLVHGEFERNDMVEYFGEQLEGFTFSKNGWVQSYGSRCVKPPIIYGDVSRPSSMTIRWTYYAQTLTNKWVKGMLTGPVTILQWSFVRNDQPRSETCTQIALAIRDEVVELEKNGIKIIQIDEPAIREGLPLRKENWPKYLEWAINTFKISASGVKDDTQIHTHMCYSEFNDIIRNIADMDADVITIECSRSQMELLNAFSDFKYPNDIGPGVYDIHSPIIPTKNEMVELINKATKYIPSDQIWINPDCGLKTRNWEETKKALIEMVNAAKELRN